MRFRMMSGEDEKWMTDRQTEYEVWEVERTEKWNGKGMRGGRWNGNEARIEGKEWESKMGEGRERERGIRKGRKTIGIKKKEKKKWLRSLRQSLLSLWQWNELQTNQYWGTSLLQVDSSLTHSLFLLLSYSSLILLPFPLSTSLLFPTFLFPLFRPGILLPPHHSYLSPPCFSNFFTNLTFPSSLQPGKKKRKREETKQTTTTEW